MDNIIEVNILELPELIEWKMQSDSDIVTFNVRIPCCFNGDLINLYMPITPDKRGIYWISDFGKTIRRLTASSIIDAPYSVDEKSERIKKELDAIKGGDVVVFFQADDFVRAFRKIIDNIEKMCEEYNRRANDGLRGVA